MLITFFFTFRSLSSSLHPYSTSLFFICLKKVFFSLRVMSAGKHDYMQQMVIMLHYIELYAVHIMSSLLNFMLRSIVTHAQ